MCGIGYSFTPKPDVVAVHFLIFLNGLTGVVAVFLLQGRVKAGLIQGYMEDTRALSSEVNNIDSATAAHKLPGTVDGAEISLHGIDPGLAIPISARQRNRASSYCLRFCKILNRFLKFVHWAMSVMFVAGAINLALTYRFTNPYVIYIYHVGKY